MPDFTSRLSENQRLLAVAFIGFLVGVIATSLLFAAQDNRRDALENGKGQGSGEEDAQTPAPVAPSPTPAPTATQTVPPAVAGSVDRVIVEDQSASTQVGVAVTLTSSSWVAIHEEVDGIPGSILGAARFDAGTSAGNVRLLRATEAGKQYFARLYRDDGDRQFDFTKDVLIVGLNSQPIQDSFQTRGE